MALVDDILYWVGVVVVLKVVSGIVGAALYNAYAFYLHNPKLKKFGEWAGASKTSM